MKNQPAFPQIKSKKKEVEQCRAEFDNPAIELVSDISSVGGLTKRELFAAMAMQAIITNDNYLLQRNEELEKLERYKEEELENVVGRTAVNYADALIAELEK